MRQSTLRLSFVRVEDWEQAIQLMDVRNECREGMTHNTGWIDAHQQRLFFKDHLDKIRGDGKYEAYLLQDNGFPIGYGLLKWDDKQDAYWMTAGLIKEYRGRGLSRFLISLITEMGHREGADVYIDVWEDNLAIIGDIKVGYEVIDQKLPEGPNGRVLNIMKHNRERPIRKSEQTLLTKIKNKNDSKPFEMSPILKELEEVDAISRQSYNQKEV